MSVLLRFKLSTELLIENNPLSVTLVLLIFKYFQTRSAVIYQLTIEQY